MSKQNRSWELYDDDAADTTDDVRDEGYDRVSDDNGRVICKQKHRRVWPKTENQGIYLDAIRNETNRLIFCGGPAGTGKTHIAAGAAAEAFRAGRIKQIVCVRPAVEAGERLGFLPGDQDEKMLPYLRPLLVQISKFFTVGEMAALRRGETPAVEIQPLSFMRGLTFEHAYVLIDEAQNCTHEQLKMAITRMGKNCKIIINGDTTQCDLPYRERGGFDHFSRLWDDVDGVANIWMTGRDVVRDPFLQKLMMRLDDTKSSNDHRYN